MTITLTNAEVLNALAGINKALEFTPVHSTKDVPAQKGLPGKLVYGLCYNAQKLDAYAKKAERAQNVIIRQFNGVATGAGGWNFTMNIETDEALSDDENARVKQREVVRRQISAAEELESKVLGVEVTIEGLRPIPFSLLEDLPISVNLIPRWMMTFDEEPEAAPTNGQSQPQEVPA